MLWQRHIEEKAALLLIARQILFLVQEHVGEEGWRAGTAAALLKLLLLGKQGNTMPSQGNNSLSKNDTLLHSLFAQSQLAQKKSNQSDEHEDAANQPPACDSLCGTAAQKGSLSTACVHCALCCLLLVHRHQHHSWTSVVSHCH